MIWLLLVHLAAADMGSPLTGDGECLQQLCPLIAACQMVLDGILTATVNTLLPTLHPQLQAPCTAF